MGDEYELLRHALCHPCVCADLQRHGGGAIVNMMAVVAVANAPVFSSYSASKAALHSLTQGVRAELAPRGTQVIGVFPGPVDTDMAEGVPMDKVAPIAVAQATLEAVSKGLMTCIPIRSLRVSLRRSPNP